MIVRNKEAPEGKKNQFSICSQRDGLLRGSTNRLEGNIMEKTLFLKNNPLVSFKWSSDGCFSVTKIHEKDFSLWPHILQKNHDQQLIKEWLSNRITPTGKKILKRIEEATKAEGILGKVALTKGLSLNDSFWVGDDSERFEDVNLYNNSFSEEVAELAFSADTRKIISFASRSPEYASEGAMRKCWIKRNNAIFLMKIDDWHNTGNYNQVFAEYFAMQFAEAFGINHVEYFLENRINHEGKEEIVTLCPIFTSTEHSFLSAKNFFIYNGISENDLLPSWLESPIYHEKLMDNFGRKAYEDMMIFDAIIGNQDRHLSNFGYMYNSNTCQLETPAPLYDHGFSLLSGVIGREEMSLEECINNSDRGAFLDFSKQIKYFIRERHYDMVANLKKFELKQHPILKVSDETIEKIQEYTSFRINECLEYIEKISTS